MGPLGGRIISCSNHGSNLQTSIIVRLLPLRFKKLRWGPNLWSVSAWATQEQNETQSSKCLRRVCLLSVVTRWRDCYKQTDLLLSQLLLSASRAFWILSVPGPVPGPKVRLCPPIPLVNTSERLLNVQSCVSTLYFSSFCCHGPWL